MDERHSLLRRQIKKHLGPEAAADPAWAAFLDAVDAAYRESDEDRRMQERAFELASRELLDANARLEEAKEDAERANLAKRRFLAGMSHELRTPLYAVVGYAEILEQDLQKLSQDEMSRQAADIRAAGRHLLELINGLLDFAKIEAGHVDVRLAEFDVDELLRDLAEILKPLADHNGNRLVLAVPAPVGRMRSDATKVRQILLNLLSNANKFTTSGTITLSACRGEDAGGTRLVFSVRDTGVGIPLERRARLFEPFAQSTPTPGRAYAGTGLGLAITREYCRALGGTVDADSEPGRGSTFTVRLPGALTVAAPAAASTGSRRA